jgi:F420-0:gamma-glutamyl ligase
VYNVKVVFCAIGDYTKARGSKMERLVGTVSRGIRGPIIREGDDLVKITVDSVLAAAESEGFSLRDRDVIAITESVVARAQGNYATVDDIAEDVKKKLGGETVGVIFPILSRNRFAINLRGIARGCKKIVLMLSYPSDEVGNALLTYDQLDDAGVNPYSDVLTLEKYRELFGENKHEFTGVDYVQYYSDIIKGEGCEVEIIFANRAKTILDYVDKIITCDIHTRVRTKRILRNSGARVVCGLDDLLTAPVNGSGCNEKYGLLGSNKSTEEKIKLFPRDCDGLVVSIQDEILKKTGKHVEVMVYGDGAFKDPQGKIWELADPVVSPAYTDGLIGTPNELKLKYLADNDFANLSGDALKEAISEKIRSKDGNLKGNMASQGTTPRQLTDLIGSLCDLTSGSGDKGTPIILIQGYFDNYTNE